jgi:hypothetical protein
MLGQGSALGTKGGGLEVPVHRALLQYSVWLQYTQVMFEKLQQHLSQRCVSDTAVLSHSLLASSAGPWLLPTKSLTQAQQAGVRPAWTK